MTHGPSPAQAPDFLFRLTDNVRSREWSEEDLDRIIVDQNPDTEQEEEYMHLTNLRGSLDWLGWQCLEASSIPPEQKSQFAVDEIDSHLKGVDLERAITSLRKWARQHPEEASKPIIITSGIREQAVRLHDRLESLAEFYNEKQPLVATYKVVYPQGYQKPTLYSDEYWEARIAMSKYDNDMMRYSVFGSLFDLLGATRQRDALIEAIGAKERD
jgi:hypothetical protein